MVVGVASAELVKAQGDGDESLNLTLRVTNLADEPIDYFGWADPGAKVTLRDQSGNYYNCLPSALRLPQTVEPRRTIVENLAFEKPLASASALDLDLPTRGEPYQFRIPVAFIQRPAPQAAPQMAKKQPAADAQIPAYDPERDEKLIADVNDVYETAMHRMEARSLGMSTNNGLRFRKTERERVLKTLAQKLDLTVDQVKEMLKSR
jgi:hypothetical protein